MHHLVQHGKVRSQVINVPEGLPELLSDITREVLRCQPTTECLCQFIIDYLTSVIATRDKATISKSIIDQALSIVEDVIANMCVCDIPKAKAEYMIEAMEECFRRFLAQRRCEKGNNTEIIKFNECDTLDELLQKCKFNKDELKISKPLIEAAYQKFLNVYLIAKDSSGGTDTLYEYFREREIARLEQRLKEGAAIKIQSVFRGFQLRKSLFVDNPSSTTIPKTIEPESDGMKEEMAALKIQTFFKRNLTVLKNSKVEENSQNNSNEGHHETNRYNDRNEDNEIQTKLIQDNEDNTVMEVEPIIEGDAVVKDFTDVDALIEDEHVVKWGDPFSENESVNENSPGIGGELEDKPVSQNKLVSEDNIIEDVSINEYNTAIDNIKAQSATTEEEEEAIKEQDTEHIENL